MKDQWRVGKRVGSDLWLVKQAPGWRVAYRCKTLSQAAAWLAFSQGADVSKVPVLVATDGHRWPTLEEMILSHNDSVKSLS